MGQYPNVPVASGGNSPPGGYGRGPNMPTQPTQQAATFGGPASPNGFSGDRIPEARPYGPVYQPGQPVNG